MEKALGDKRHVLNLTCEGCLSLSLRDELQLQKINHWYSLRIQQLELVNQPRVIFLCESFPKDRYIYDLETKYHNKGLRFNLKTELYNSSCTDEQFILNLRSDKILILDCAFCPLYLLDSNTFKRQAATHCLKQHTLPILNQFPNIPIITIFPRNRGFLKRQFPDLSGRIVANFDFGNLKGLKNTLNKLNIKAK